MGRPKGSKNVSKEAKSDEDKKIFEWAKLTGKQVDEATLDDELEKFFLGLVDDSSQESVAIFGCTFEKQQGTWDSDRRRWSWSAGRVALMPARKIEAIKAKAKTLFNKRLYRYAKDGTKKFVRVTERAVATKPSGRRKMARSQNRSDKKGRILEEWRCVFDDIIIEPVKGEQGIDDLAKANAQIRKLQAQLAEKN